MLNPIASQLDVMRTTLLGGLLESCAPTSIAKPERVRVFEVGRCFLRDGERYRRSRCGSAAWLTARAAPSNGDGDARDVDFYDIKGDLEALAAPLAVTTEAAQHPALHPGRSARVLIDRQ